MQADLDNVHTLAKIFYSFSEKLVTMVYTLSFQYNSKNNDKNNNNNNRTIKV